MKFDPAIHARTYSEFRDTEKPCFECELEKATGESPLAEGEHTCDPDGYSALEEQELMLKTRGRDA